MGPVIPVYQTVGMSNAHPEGTLCSSGGLQIELTGRAAASGDGARNHHTQQADCHCHKARRHDLQQGKAARSGQQSFGCPTGQGIAAMVAAWPLRSPAARTSHAGEHPECFQRSRVCGRQPRVRAAPLQTARPPDAQGRCVGWGALMKPERTDLATQGSCMERAF